MKVTLPESIEEITLETFQRYQQLKDRKDLDTFEFNKRKIEIFTNLNRKQIKNVNQSDYKWMLDQIDTALNQDAEFKNTFEIGAVKFGFIPNLDKCTTGEYTDLRKYQEGGIETMHNLMAVLFRPIIKTDKFKNYEIISYFGTEQFADTMKKMPLSIVNGALVFFLNLAKELSSYTQKYTLEEPMKEK